MVSDILGDSGHDSCVKLGTKNIGKVGKRAASAECLT